MADNEILPFANIGGANVMPQADYAALAARPTGFSAGIARSTYLNKVWRQASLVASGIAQFIVDALDEDVVDDGDQVAFAAKFLRALSARTREKVYADLNLYVNDATGNDTNDGLTIGTPVKTIQRAWDMLFLNYDMNNHNVVINVANGTYTNAVKAFGTPVGMGGNTTITFRGNTTTPSTCVISVVLSTCFSIANSDVSLKVEGFRLLATGTPGTYSSNGTAIVVERATLTINRLEFGVCGGYHMQTFSGGLILSNQNPYSIVGGAQAHVGASRGGSIVIVQSTITLVGTPAFSSSFCACSSCGIAELYASIWSGAATGMRYNASENAVIVTLGGGPTYLPGSTPGAVITGGQYN